MKKYALFLITLLCIPFFFSCKKSESTTTGNTGPTYPIADTTGPVVQIDSFPLAIGNKWVYAVFNSTDSSTTYDTLSAVSDTMINGTKAIKITGATYTGYFTNKNDGLYEIAYNGNNKSMFNQLSGFNNSGAFVLLDQPDYIAKFPLTINDTFSNQEQSGSYRITRQWTKYATVHTAGATYNTVKLTLQTELSPSVIEIQYYSSKGLVKDVLMSLKAYAPGKANYEILKSYTLIHTNF